MGTAATGCDQNSPAATECCNGVVVVPLQYTPAVCLAALQVLGGIDTVIDTDVSTGVMLDQEGSVYVSVEWLIASCSHVQDIEYTLYPRINETR
jgi:hypothetical protein